MNQVYRVIWNQCRQIFVAVSELAKACGKRASGTTSEGGCKSQTMRRKILAAAVAACFMAPVYANPIGAQVVNGVAAINQAGNTLTVTNSPNAIINWQSFSINPAETTRFVQQSAASAVLNRVLGPDPSQLLGALQSNGRVFLINPAGILVGQGARIDVAGFVASTLNLSDADFLANRLNFGPNLNAGAIQNLGSITTPDGGTVYLVAPQVDNQGIITTPKGETILAAGNTVQLIDSGAPGVAVQITGSAGNATNLGQILADSGRIGMVAAAVKNSGTLSANSLVNQGGRIYLKATQHVEAGGTISAQGAGGGTINVLADMQTGTVNVTGTLDASAPGSGKGGFIETSAAHVQVANTAHVTTLAAHGNSGNWLIDPLDYTIAAAGGNITGAMLGYNLGFGNVVITNIAGTGNGDIFVNDVVSWTSVNSLTLNAARNINVNSPITNLGTGDIVLTAATGNIAANAPISTGGFALLYTTQGAITDGNGAALNVAANDFEAWAANGINLDTNVNSILAINKVAGDIVLREADGASLYNVWNGNPAGLITLTTATGALTSALTNLGVPNTVGVGGVVQYGQWTVSGGQSIVSPANPRYTFTTAGGMTEISLMSPRSSALLTDPYLYLLDSAGNVVAFDDDGGIGYTSLIRTNLLPGTYTVVAATWAAGDTYPFALTIGDATQGAPATVQAAIQQQAAAVTTAITTTTTAAAQETAQAAAQETAQAAAQEAAQAAAQAAADPNMPMLVGPTGGIIGGEPGTFGGSETTEDNGEKEIGSEKPTDC